MYSSLTTGTTLRAEMVCLVPYGRSGIKLQMAICKSSILSPYYLFNPHCLNKPNSEFMLELENSIALTYHY